MEKETRIVKIEKGLFMVEFRDKSTRFAEWKIVNKEFKTRTKAEQYIREKLF